MNGDHAELDRAAMPAGMKGLVLFPRTRGCGGTALNALFLEGQAVKGASVVLGESDAGRDDK